MRITSGCSAELRPPLMTRLARYRHRVFVETLGWQLQCRDALEWDQFDREDTLYVIAQNAVGDVIGTARLLPTTRPYLLSEVFPVLLNGAANGAMPSWKQLSDTDIAAVVSYTKNNWSNKTGQLVQPAEIVAQRGK